MSRLGALIAYAVMLAAVMVRSGMAGPKDPTQEYNFDIGQYELSFSVPKAFLADLWNKPDHYDPEWRKRRPGEGSSADYFFHIHMFSGPFWVGNYAAIDFTVTEFEADSAYNGPVSSLEDLEEYKKWQLEFTRSYESYEFSKKMITGYAWLKKTLVRRDSDRVGKHGDENTILLLPLGNRRYLQVLCRITELVPDKSGRWRADAHKMRDQLINSVALRKKAN